MPAYAVSTVPYPPTETHVTSYFTIRLLGLQRDAHAFGSTYGRESTFTREQWRARLDALDRTTFFVRTEPPPSDLVADSTETWVGTASLLSPAFLTEVGFSPPRHLVEEDEAVYILVGMWIHTDHRRRGLGKRVIETVMEKVWSEDGETRRKVLMLQVHEQNTAAKGLYERLGFVDGGPDSDSPGEIWMTFRKDRKGGTSQVCTLRRIDEDR
ncbi:hypothetical protein LshimejAT787_0505700 [Lyophyllum shimeji]|uniref:N-acetyltransferase domain-containing protein n=1 Tax=Lyophyllum shimeji TaxID=47721 RepID=A0A9P3PMN7_LYOSH|nr:hypothetical protein LshimejAT787_0505700 [Lyophyllum shimeji]